MARWRSLTERARLCTSRPTPGTLEIRYLPGPGIVEELRYLVALEAECCAFLTLAVESTADQVILTARRSAGAPADVSEQLSTLVSVMTGGLG